LILDVALAYLKQDRLECPHVRSSRLERRTSNSSGRSYDNINNCLLWQLVASLDFKRAIDRADDGVAIL